MEVDRILEELVERYPKLAAVRSEIEAAYHILETCYQNGGKLLIAGNGGSSADAEHIVGELMKGFVKRRELPNVLQTALEAEDPEGARRLRRGCRAVCRPSPSAGIRRCLPHF